MCGLSPKQCTNVKMLTDIHNPALPFHKQYEQFLEKENVKDREMIEYLARTILYETKMNTPTGLHA